MSIEQILIDRSGHQCELCGSSQNLAVFSVEPSDGSADQMVYICETCQSQINAPDTIDPNHWRCLNEAMWSTTPAVQVMAYRMLHALKTEGWPQQLLDMMYLEDDLKNWADQSIVEEDDKIIHRDSNGALLQEGDSVTLIKDLDVKGAGFTAKRGTLVKSIHLTEDPKFIEGKVNGTQIVLVAAYLKKA